jgi:hypothetical protein
MDAARKHEQEIPIAYQAGRAIHLTGVDAEERNGRAPA